MVWFVAAGVGWRGLSSSVGRAVEWADQSAHGCGGGSAADNLVRADHHAQPINLAESPGNVATEGRTNRATRRRGTNAWAVPGVGPDRIKEEQVILVASRDGHGTHAVDGTELRQCCCTGSAQAAMQHKNLEPMVHWTENAARQSEGVDRGQLSTSPLILVASGSRLKIDWNRWKMPRDAYLSKQGR